MSIIKKALLHITIVIVSLFLIIGVPFLVYFDKIFPSDDTDAVSSASLVIPEKPSGEIYVYMNTEKHADSLSLWEDFFNERDEEVIFDDVRCMVAIGDVTGVEAARRFMAKLPENQMTIYKENVSLVVSRTENAMIDVVILSKETVDSFAVKNKIEGVTVFAVKGGST